MERDYLSNRPLAPYALPAAPGTSPAGVALGFLADLAAVALFVLIGRHSHGEADSTRSILTTAWPFMVGVAGGYVPIVPLRWPVTALRSGLTVVAKTVILGMLLRAGVQHSGTPFSFIVVTVIFLSLFMLGWRQAAVRVPFLRDSPLAAKLDPDTPSIL